METAPHQRAEEGMAAEPLGGGWVEALDFFGNTEMGCMTRSITTTAEMNVYERRSCGFLDFLCTSGSRK